MLKILEIYSAKQWGGAETRTIGVINHLDPTKFAVQLVVHPEGEVFARKNAITAKTIPVKIRNSYDLIALYQILKLILKNKIDLIVTHTPHDGRIGLLAGLLTKTPCIHYRHTTPNKRNYFYYNFYAKVITDSCYVRKLLEACGVKKEKIVVIHNGIDTEKFKPSRAGNLQKYLNLTNDEILIGIVAYLRLEKRHKDLIEAFCLLKEVHVKLIIMGDGPLKTDLERLAQTKKRAHDIIFLGECRNIEQILPDLDICVLSSNKEAAGIAVAEAESCGVPVIGSNAGGIPEYILPGETGIIFQKENIVDLKDKLESLIKDPSLRKSMGQKAREHILKHFSSQEMMRKTEELYQAVLAPKHSSNFAKID